MSGRMSFRVVRITYFPLGKSEDFVSDSRGLRIRRRKSLLSRCVRRLHDYVGGDVIFFVGPVIYGGDRTNFQTSLNLGRVVDQELESDQVLALFHVDGKGSVPNCRDFPGNGGVLGGFLRLEQAM